MKKSSTLWQGFVVAGITALAAPTFVHGQAAGGAAGGAGSSGITSGSPSPSGSQTGVSGSQNAPIGSPSTSGNQSGVSDSNIGRTPGVTGSQGMRNDSSGDTAGATNPNDMTSAPGGLSSDVGISVADQRLNAQIRQSLSADTSLSGVGQNVQLSTAQGEVTLRGTVGSEREKLQIEQKVKQQSQVQEVTNELQVVEGSSTSSPRINR
jgi:hypothetical protein